MPGGVNSPVRSFSTVGGEPFTVAFGDGPWVHDVEGRRYLDFVQSYGAVLLGHAHPKVTEAIAHAARSGTSFGMPTRGEVLLAEAVSDRVPGCEQVRFVSSGTEATMSAVRLARGATGRDRIVKFAGCYHGHFDGLLTTSGSGVAALGLPGSAGVPASTVAETLVVPYNVVPDLTEEVACVIIEPVAANMNLVRPRDGFLSELRAACDAVGALLIFDEVITGFRIGEGGASVHFGVEPDIWCFGKVIGGGLPVGAFGGGSDLMSALAPLGPVYQAGTLSGNPVAMAAGRAVLEEMSASEYAALSDRASRWSRELASALIEGGLAATVQVAGPLVGVLVGRPGADIEVPYDYASVRAAVSSEIYAQLFHALLDRGVAWAPGPFEVLFVGMAHGDAELEFATEMARDAARAVSSGSMMHTVGSASH